jgi:hypothetical protein
MRRSFDLDLSWSCFIYEFSNCKSFPFPIGTRILCILLCFGTINLWPFVSLIYQSKCWSANYHLPEALLFPEFFYSLQQSVKSNQTFRGLACLVLSDQPISLNYAWHLHHFFLGSLTPFLIFYFYPGVRIDIPTNCLEPMGCCGSVNYFLLLHYSFCLLARHALPFRLVWYALQIRTWQYMVLLKENIY